MEDYLTLSRRAFITIISLFSFMLLTSFLGFNSIFAADGFSLVDDEMRMKYYETDTINVLENDTYTDFYELKIIEDTPNGLLTYDNSGEITYKPLNSFYGYDQFVYGLFDNRGLELDRATVNVAVISPWSSGDYTDLYIFKTDNDAEAYLCSTVTYELVYANVGDMDADNTFIKEYIPMYTTFNSELSSDGWVCDESECLMEVGVVEANSDPTSIIFAVDVKSEYHNEHELLTNKAMIGVVHPFNPEDPTFGDSNPESNHSSDQTNMVYDMSMCDEEEREDNISNPNEVSDSEVVGENIANDSEELTVTEEGDVLGANDQSRKSGEVLGAETLAETGVSLYKVIGALFAVTGGLISLIVLPRKGYLR